VSAAEPSRGTTGQIVQYFETRILRHVTDVVSCFMDSQNSADKCGKLFFFLQIFSVNI
jgi:hypothetical protein